MEILLLDMVFVLVLGTLFVGRFAPTSKAFSPYQLMMIISALLFIVSGLVKMARINSRDRCDTIASGCGLNVRVFGFTGRCSHQSLMHKHRYLRQNKRAFLPGKAVLFIDYICATEYSRVYFPKYKWTRLYKQAQRI